MCAFILMHWSCEKTTCSTLYIVAARAVERGRWSFRPLYKSKDRIVAARAVERGRWSFRPWYKSKDRIVELVALWVDNMMSIVAAKHIRRERFVVTKAVLHHRVADCKLAVVHNSLALQKLAINLHLPAQGQPLHLSSNNKHICVLYLIMCG